MKLHFLLACTTLMVAMTVAYEYGPLESRIISDFYEEDIQPMDDEELESVERDAPGYYCNNMKDRIFCAKSRDGKYKNFLNPCDMWDYYKLHKILYNYLYEGYCPIPAGPRYYY